MQQLFLSLCLVAPLGVLCTQVVSSANAGSGSGYPAITMGGYEIEDPDCVHTGFGAHVTQVFDDELNKNVFLFHSHIDDDNDRCQVFDRVRMEIKGSASTIPELRHAEGEESHYRWKFRLDENFIGASSFCHLFQNKAVGGSDADFPVLTLTARASILELRHSGGDTGADLGTLAQVNLSAIRGKWIEAYMRQVHGENGQLYVTLRSMSTGLTLLEYENNSIDLWRTGATLNRPKWGVYRAKNNTLRDEIVRFDEFCVSETDSTLCPADAVLLPDLAAPSAPLNLAASNVGTNSLDLEWDAATDEYGVIAYEVFQDGELIQEVTGLQITVNALIDATTYTFTVTAKDAAGNVSSASNAIIVTTVDGISPPTAAASPFPANNAIGVSLAAVLSWQGGPITDSYEVYFGETQNPPLVASQTGNTYAPALTANTTYYWRISSINENGATTGPEWTFTTGDANQDFPWDVYRATNRAELETNFYDLNVAPEMPQIDEVTLDPNGSGNTFYSYFSEATDFRWRYGLNPEDTTITIVARLKGVDPGVEGICYFDVRMNGWRQKVRISQSTIKLERANPVFEQEPPVRWENEMHLFRMVVNGPVTTIYLDENPAPFTSITSNTEVTSNYFEWGKSGGANYGATIDWLVVDRTGAFAPGEGSPLPGDLFLSSDATLTSLDVDAVAVEGFAPTIFEYTIPVATADVPTVDYVLSSNLATATLSNPSSVPNTAATIEVTAQDGFTVSTYTLNYVQASSTVDLNGALAVKVAPNPTSQFLQVTAPENSIYRGKIVALDGKEMSGELLVQNGQSIDVSTLPAGTYLLSIYTLDNRAYGLRFVVN